jgi:hypothetical protein
VYKHLIFGLVEGPRCTSDVAWARVRCYKLHVVFFTLHVSSCMSRRGTLSATWPFAAKGHSTLVTGTSEVRCKHTAVPGQRSCPTCP